MENGLCKKQSKWILEWFNAYHCISDWIRCKFYALSRIICSINIALYFFKTILNIFFSLVYSRFTSHLNLGSIPRTNQLDTDKCHHQGTFHHWHRGTSTALKTPPTRRTYLIAWHRCIQGESYGTVFCSPAVRHTDCRCIRRKLSIAPNMTLHRV